MTVKKAEHPHSLTATGRNDDVPDRDFFLCQEDGGTGRRSGPSGARCRTRTGTLLRKADFKSAASTDSAKRARREQGLNRREP